MGHHLHIAIGINIFSCCCKLILRPWLIVNAEREHVGPEKLGLLPPYNRRVSRIAQISCKRLKLH